MGSFMIGGVIVAALILAAASGKDDKPEPTPGPEPEPEPIPTPGPIPEPEDSPAKVVDRWLSGTPQLERLYLIKRGDNASSIARQALAVNQGHPDIVPLIRSMTRVAWNKAKYATPWDPNNTNWPRFYAADIDGRPWVLAKAFLPRHKDALSLLRGGSVVPRNIDETPAGSRQGPGRAYALVWIPSEANPEPPPELRKLMPDAYRGSTLGQFTG